MNGGNNLRPTISSNKVKISSKHHCLPQFYLKGFTGNNGKFSIFDHRILEQVISRLRQPAHFLFVEKCHENFHLFWTEGIN